MDAIAIDAVDPAEPEAQDALRRYIGELADRSVGRQSTADVDDFRPPGGVFLLARSSGAVIGCGAVRALADGVGEIKRMWVEPGSRGRGVGAEMLRALEDAARALGYSRVRLDTNEALVPAIRLYEGQGYQRIKAYNDNADATHFYEKWLTDAHDASPAPKRSGR